MLTRVVLRDLERIKYHTTKRMTWLGRQLGKVPKEEKQASLENGGRMAF